jgi:aspartyl/asparaginyl-tRNA synthetase
MIEPEVAWNDSADNMRLQEDFVSYLVQRCLERRSDELKELSATRRRAPAGEGAVPPRELHGCCRNFWGRKRHHVG